MGAAGLEPWDGCTVRFTTRNKPCSFLFDGHLTDSDRTAASYDNRADLRMIAWRQWVDRPEGDHTYHAPAVIKRYGNYD